MWISDRIYQRTGAGEYRRNPSSSAEKRTTAIAGPSGVGKSSLINLLQNQVQMETGTISRKIERGKHTTRHSELIAVDADSYIMDTPGFSSLMSMILEKKN